MTVYVGSLKYSPVYKSHVCAFGNACEERGYSVRYLFSNGYKWLLSKEIKDKTTFIGNSTSISSMLIDVLNLDNKKKIKKLFVENTPSHVYMHNYHFLNHYIARLTKKQGSKFIYHIHEPYVKDKGAHGGFQQYWLYLFEFFQDMLLKNTSIALVSSIHASQLFDKRYLDFQGKKVYVPLMYEDLGSSITDIQNREYVTFVGPPVPAKNPEKYIKITQYSKKNNLSNKFMLISRSKINDDAYSQSNSKVFYKERISDEDFGDIIKKSLTVLTPYQRETQSSVILVSYMYGTPVVSSNVGGLPEFVMHRKTGYLLDVDAEPEKWIEGINYVKENFIELSKNCREYFLQNFSGKNWDKYLDTVLK